ncbi:MAG: RNA polymerase sigma factor [Acidimicrobiales bacterium]
MSVPQPDFEQFFVANYDQLVRSLTAITGDAETARDCVQDAFIKASTRWRRVRRYDSPITWVRRVAINRSRDLHRADQRRRRRERRVAPASDQRSEDESGLVDGSMRLLDLLRQLPDRQRSVAALFYVEDLPVAEIATILGISSGAVKFHLNKARQALRGAMEGEGQRYG